MIGRDNRLVMAIISSYDLGFKKNLEDPCDCAKMVCLGGFGYYGNLLVVLDFGFWCVVCQICV